MRVNVRILSFNAPSKLGAVCLNLACCRTEILPLAPRPIQQVNVHFFKQRFLRGAKCLKHVPNVRLLQAETPFPTNRVKEHPAKPYKVWPLLSLVLRYHELSLRRGEFAIPIALKH